ncbi:MAG TPA: superoxide dismutase family protein [Candidatus Pseudomonas excrementavium]|uniref:superoxide dismutase [Cu-Zn] SodC n=1 Tax=Halopseudomonas bauzanensis TaxID=653930 RepID=UPI001C3B364E|nr:superoxide dismutase [Cu-Zn] SodC [Halopseudomonas bauzanensis]HIZ51783.1 superoxide dismutase family protein [Candidatus Pseudomonas excrementavium]
MKSQKWLIVAAALMAGTVHAASQEVTINKVNADGKQESIGTIEISETDHGLLFTPQLKSLEAGVHGFHVHENGSCEAAEKDGKPTAAQAAGGHYDPQKTGKHLGPYADGHLGDLPALYVNSDGTADYPVLAPRIKKLEEIEGRALMIHAGGDNHADTPEPLGGGGARSACGVI